MHTQDASALLPHDKRQIFDSLVEEAERLMREQQLRDTARKAKPVSGRCRAG